MDKRLFDFFKGLENRVGTRKLRICFGMAVMNFLVLLMTLEDEPQNNLIENNKEEM